MDVRIKPSNLSGEIAIISSKSLSHRYVIAAALSNQDSIVKNVLESNDLQATKAALNVIGAKFEGDKIMPANFKLIANTINVNESGSTLRFMIPIYMLQNEEITIDGTNRLVDRPLDVYDEIFKDKQVIFKHLNPSHQLPVLVQGKIKGGYFPLRGDVSSQFISGLLFALPLLSRDSVIELLSPLESKGYVDLTLDVLKKYGIHILHVDQYLYIKGSQKYQAKDFVVEGDFSQSVFWIAAGLFGNQPIYLKNLNNDSLQGDKKIIEIIQQMGGDIIYNEGVYKVLPSLTKGIIIDLAQIPDLGPMLMGIAALSQGTTTFIHFERLRIKESDRVEAMKDVLSKFGVDMKIYKDKIEIIGKKVLKGNVIIDTFNDHRIAMAASILAIKADGDVLIRQAECVQKSYPTFFNEYQKLGGDIYEVR
ncbi:MAG: 3-phosphoshikimate 1-carboxyvinyltransferase [Acholeplasmataceae bacterium]